MADHDDDTPDSMTIIAFSGDLDKLWPTFILSSTGAASGMDVTVFFTFWGLFPLVKDEVRITGYDSMTKALAGMNPPGMKKAKAAMAQSGMDDKVLVHMDAIIGSMTVKERARPELMNAKRKKRVAAGSGTSVQEVNKLLKMHQEMGRAMKQIKKMGGLRGLAAMFGAGGGGGAPGGAPGGLPGLPGGGAGGLPPGMQNLLNKK